MVLPATCEEPPEPTPERFLHNTIFTDIAVYLTSVRFHCCPRPQNCEVVNAHQAPILSSQLENASLYHVIIWRPEANGGLELFGFLAKCPCLHSLTLEYDMVWWHEQLCAWRNRFTPIHGIRQVGHSVHLSVQIKPGVCVFSHTRVCL